MREARSRRTKPVHALWLAAAAFAALAVLIPSAAVAQPVPANELSIVGQADYISGAQIVVYVTVEGKVPGFGFVDINVQQPQPFGTTFGNGGAPVLCDGRRHTYAVTVNFNGGPPFQLGEALATGQVFCPSPATAGSDSRTIRITKP
jgi:hypothetical protein